MEILFWSNVERLLSKPEIFIYLYTLIKFSIYIIKNMLNFNKQDIANKINSINDNKLFLGLALLILNVGGKFFSNELT